VLTLLRAGPRSAVLALALAVGAEAAQTDRVQQYLGLAQATLKEPIAPAELDAAILSAAGIQDVSSLFEAALASSLAVDGSVVTPELGGEATLDGGRLRFVTYADAIHSVLRRMVELEGDPVGLLAFLSASPPGQRVLATTGGLHALLYQMTTRPPTEAQRRVLHQVLRGAVETHFKTWSVSPEVQREAIRQHDWRGRYVGFWHLHPPRPAAESFAPGLEPSMEDMTVAVEQGQFLTLVFQPDGFDLYDLAPLAVSGTPSLSNVRIVRHRSADWERRFRALLR
jgi:hypothetical protein